MARLSNDRILALARTRPWFAATNLQRHDTSAAARDGVFLEAVIEAWDPPVSKTMKVRTTGGLDQDAVVVAFTVDDCTIAGCRPTLLAVGQTDGETYHIPFWSNR